MNVSELLRLLQTEHDETAARADNLREQIERLTTALAEAEARLAELAATRKVIDGVTPPDHATAPAQTATATVYQRIVTTFNEHLGKVFRVRDLHEHLGLPTDELAERQAQAERQVQAAGLPQGRAAWHARAGLAARSRVRATVLRLRVPWVGSGWNPVWSWRHLW